jgi:uncharacterized protein YndB with AHSA1/START domain
MGDQAAPPFISATSHARGGRRVCIHVHEVHGMVRECRALVSNVIHGDFEVRREFDWPIRDLWRAFTEADFRARWKRIPGSDSRRSYDFREGGHEVVVGSFAPSGVVEELRTETHFIDVVEGERLVFSYDLTLDGVRRWASLVTLTFQDRGESTLVTHREQYVFLSYTDDGAHDVAHLRGSVGLAWNALNVALT